MLLFSIVILVMAPCHQPHFEAVVPAPMDPPDTADSEPVTTRPGRTCCLPHRFRGPTPPNGNEPITAFSEASETFDLADISENDNDEEPPIPRAQGDIIMNTTRSTPATDPLLTNTWMNSPGSSADVLFFFHEDQR